MKGAPMIADLVTSASKALTKIEPDLGRQFCRTPVSPGNRFACVTRQVGTMETVLRVRWGIGGRIAPGSPEGTVFELLALLRAAVAAVLHDPEEVEWLEALARRARALVEDA